jgi:hypothetical protein
MMRTYRNNKGGERSVWHMSLMRQEVALLCCTHLSILTWIQQNWYGVRLNVTLLGTLRLSGCGKFGVWWKQLYRIQWQNSGHIVCSVQSEKVICCGNWMARLIAIFRGLLSLRAASLTIHIRIQNTEVVLLRRASSISGTPMKVWVMDLNTRHDCNEGYRMRVVTALWTVGCVSCLQCGL